MLQLLLYYVSFFANRLNYHYYIRKSGLVASTSNPRGCWFDHPQRIHSCGLSKGFFSGNGHDSDSYQLSVSCIHTLKYYDLRLLMPWQCVWWCSIFWNKPGLVWEGYSTIDKFYFGFLILARSIPTVFILQCLVHGLALKRGVPVMHLKTLIL